MAAVKLIQLKHANRATTLEFVLIAPNMANVNTPIISLGKPEECDKILAGQITTNISGSILKDAIDESSPNSFSSSFLKCGKN